MSPKPETCPVCGQPTQRENRPFCGKGCRDRDLLQWLGEGYRMPAVATDEAMQKNGNYGLDSELD